MTRSEAEAATILRCEVGSTAHGVSTGSDDRDEMGILFEPIEDTLGLGAPFEQYIFRSAAERTGRSDAKSEAGDLDLTLYSLRKWMGLALKGNPTILSLLFAPVIQSDARGIQLRELAPAIVSRQAGKAYLGYMTQQRLKMLGERTNRVRRPDLVEKFGFDTKFAYHALRLGFQGIELLTTGKFSMPIEKAHRDYLLEIRKGVHPMDYCVRELEVLERKVKELTESGPIREKPDTKVLEDWMIERYYTQWSATYGHQLTMKFAKLRERNLARLGLDEAEALILGR